MVVWAKEPAEIGSPMSDKYLITRSTPELESALDTILEWLARAAPGTNPTVSAAIRYAIFTRRRKSAEGRTGCITIVSQLIQHCKGYEHMKIIVPLIIVLALLAPFP
jgi:hypothetical protein